MSNGPEGDAGPQYVAGTPTQRTEGSKCDADGSEEEEEEQEGDVRRETSAMLDVADKIQPLMPHKRGQPLVGGLTEDVSSKHWLAELMSSFIIMPGTGGGLWRLEVWDAYVVVMVLFVAYYEPFCAALFKVGKEPRMYASINSLLGFSFCIDMVIQFFIAIPRAEDSLHKDLWEKNPVVLARIYVGIPYSSGQHGGWFWLDLLSISPNLIFAIFGRTHPIANPLLLIRIFRMFQTRRLLRLQKLAELLHTKFGFPLYLMVMLKFFVITTLTCHIMACTWVLAEGKAFAKIMNQNDEEYETWLSALVKSKGDICVPDVRNDPVCVYTLAYYWATTTLTGVGYGDITPQNKMEYALSFFGMMVVGYTWAYIVGSIVSVLSHQDPGETEFKRRLDELNELSRRRLLPEDLQVRLRQYMHETRHFAVLNEQRKLVETCLSDGLQREVAALSAEVRSIVKGVFWMGNLDKEAILDIVRALQPNAFSKQEVINMPDTMFMIQKGIVAVRGRVLVRGDVWGYCDILLETRHLKYTADPRTLSFVEILTLTKRSLLHICRNYPNCDQRLRRAQIRVAVFRGFIWAADRERRRRAAEEGTESPTRRKSQPQVNAPPDRPRAEGSFLNPGMRPAANLTLESAREVSLPELKQLLTKVLNRQHEIETTVEEISTALGMPTSEAAKQLQEQLRAVDENSVSSGGKQGFSLGFGKLRQRVPSLGLAGFSANSSGDLLHTGDLSPKTIGTPTGGSFRRGASALGSWMSATPEQPEERAGSNQAPAPGDSASRGQSKWHAAEFEVHEPPGPAGGASTPRISPEAAASETADVDRGLNTRSAAPAFRSSSTIDAL